MAEMPSETLYDFLRISKFGKIAEYDNRSRGLKSRCCESPGNAPQYPQLCFTVITASHASDADGGDPIAAIPR